jgi:hypothetical protein
MGLMVQFAAADQFSTALPDAFGNGEPGGPIVDEYQWDDGTSENSVGLTAGGELWWINEFAVQAGYEFITGVSTCFGTPMYPGSSGVTPGQEFKVYVWGDDNGNNIPTDGYGCDLLGTAVGAVAAGSIDSDVLQTVPINVDVSGYTNFYIGASVVHNPYNYPAPLDQTTSQNHSWVGFGSPLPDHLSGVIDVDIYFPGNWLLRANAVPEPAGLMLLGLGALLLRRR